MLLHLGALGQGPVSLSCLWKAIAQISRDMWEISAPSFMVVHFYPFVFV